MPRQTVQPWTVWTNRLMRDPRWNKDAETKLKRDYYCDLAAIIRVNKFVPYYPWSPMQEAMVLAPEREVLAGGEAGCIAGETRIYNPVTGRHYPRVDELAGCEIAPLVLTLNGPVQAEIPYLKGVDNLYRVTLYDDKSCVVTMDHKFLTPHGWVKLSTLDAGDLISAPTDSLFGANPWRGIESIRFERRDVYYDLHVPGEEHYMAEGIWHHNSGKTDAALFCALVNVTVEDYLATYFRESERQLSAGGGIIWQMRRFLKDYLGNEVVWNEDRKEFYFREFNSIIGFGFMGEQGDEENYIGYPRQLFGWEELTRFPFHFERAEGRGIWNPFQFLNRSLRKPPGMPVNLRTVATTNPGGSSKKFVKDYFLPAAPKGVRVPIPDSESYIVYQAGDPITGFGSRRYVHGVRKENPGLDHPSYDESQSLADEQTQAEQFGGDWEYEESGGVFKAERIVKLPIAPPFITVAVRGWDKAGTQGGKGPRTAGTLIGRIPKGYARSFYGAYFADKPAVLERLGSLEFVILHVIAGRWGDDIREQNIDAMATGGTFYSDTGRAYEYPGDGRATRIVQEQELGSGGKQSARFTGTRLAGLGYPVESVISTNNKEARARPMVSAVNQYMYGVVESDGRDGSSPTEEIINEFVRFHNDAKIIDIVDAAVHAHNLIVLTPESPPPDVGVEDRSEWDLSHVM